jgi:hypothetical protein
MRLAWTLIATVFYWALALVYPWLATLLVPVYCFAVVLPYGVEVCHRRWDRYRHAHGAGTHAR